MADVEFEMFGDRDIEALLLRIFGRVNDLRPFWNRFANALARYNKRVFQSEGRAYGAPWAPLSPDYGAWKAANYPAKTILRREDDLYKSLAQRPLGVERIGRRTAEFGTDIDYAEFHQTGTRFMPARPPVAPGPVFRSVMRAEVNRLLGDHIAKAE